MLHGKKSSATTESQLDSSSKEKGSKLSLDSKQTRKDAVSQQAEEKGNSEEKSVVETQLKSTLSESLPTKNLLSSANKNKSQNSGLKAKDSKSMSPLDTIYSTYAEGRSQWLPLFKAFCEKELKINSPGGNERERVLLTNPKFEELQRKYKENLSQGSQPKDYLPSKPSLPISEKQTQELETPTMKTNEPSKPSKEASTPENANLWEAISKHRGSQIGSPANVVSTLIVGQQGMNLEEFGNNSQNQEAGENDTLKEALFSNLKTQLPQESFQSSSPVHPSSLIKRLPSRYHLKPSGRKSTENSTSKDRKMLEEGMPITRIITKKMRQRNRTNTSDSSEDEEDDDEEEEQEKKRRGSFDLLDLEDLHTPGNRCVTTSGTNQKHAHQRRFQSCVVVMNGMMKKVIIVCSNILKLSQILLCFRWLVEACF